MRKIDWFIIHCTAGSQKATIEDIEKDWKERLKWKTPGYHILIRPDGTYKEMQPIEKISNGVKGHNHNSINISYIGGIDKNGKAVDNRTDAQISTMIAILKDLESKFPSAKVKGHRDFSDDKNGNGIIDPWERIKECPCFDAITWWDTAKKI